MKLYHILFVIVIVMTVFVQFSATSQEVTELNISGCKSDGERCTANNICCSGTCIDIYGESYCVPKISNNCKANGDICTTDKECCNQKCMDNYDGKSYCVQKGTGSIGYDCKGNGGICNGDNECCSGICLLTSARSLKCSAPIHMEVTKLNIIGCKRDGEKCTTNKKCCSGTCIDIYGESYCVPKISNNCKANGDICTTDNECCNQKCMDNYDGKSYCVQKGTGSIGYDCKGNGGICNGDNECCSGICLLTSARSLECSAPIDMIVKSNAKVALKGEKTDVAPRGPFENN